MSTKKLNNPKGLAVVISSPSGGGKTTVIHRLLSKKHRPYVYSVSMTTRPPRQGEKNGRDYWFVSEEDFKKLIDDGKLVEFARVHGHYYGTPKKPLQDWLKQGKIVLMDLDVFGAESIKKYFADRSLLIFLKPPNLNVLKERLVRRSTERTEEIEKRLSRVDMEMNYMDKFDIVIVNDNLEGTVNKVDRILLITGKGGRFHG